MPMKNRDVSMAMMALISISLLTPLLSAQNQSDVSKSGQWRIAGQNLNNSRNQAEEHLISSANVQRLNPKWVFTTGGDVSATPTVE
jgi:polyvinyl alcohol dehydrogenase (cytochrome)